MRLLTIWNLEYSEHDRDLKIPHAIKIIRHVIIMLVHAYTCMFYSVLIQLTSLLPL